MAKVDTTFFPVHTHHARPITFSASLYPSFPPYIGEDSIKRTAETLVQSARTYLKFIPSFSISNMCAGLFFSAAVVDS